MTSFTVHRGDLAPVLDRAHRIVERRNTIPIQSHVRMVAEDGRLAVTATDLDIELRASLPLAGNSSRMSFALPSGLLRDFVKKLPDKAEIALSLDGSQVKLVSGRTRATLHALPAEDFPDMEAGSFTHAFDIAPKDFSAILESCQFAISTEETRYYLNGIYLHTVEDLGPSKLRAVATDGHRLGRREMDAPDGADRMPGIILPRKTVSELIALLAGDGKEEARIELSEAKFRIAIGDIVLTSKLIDGTYPDYQRVVPAGNANRFTLSREAFAAALDRVTTIAGDRGKAVRITFSDGEAALECVNPDSGEANDAVPTRAAEGEAVTIGFNGRYALDIAGEVEGDDIVFHLGDAGGPAVVTGAAPDPLFVIMPMRIGQ